LQFHPLQRRRVIGFAVPGEIGGSKCDVVASREISGRDEWRSDEEAIP
jgi:hypothetical protein